MALHRSSVSGRNESRNAPQKEDETENNGYIQVLVKPLEQGNLSLILNWFGISRNRLTNQQIGAVYGISVIVCSVLFYQILRCDIGSVFQRICGLLVPMFTIVCSFYWLSLYLRKTWNTTSIYLLFSSCLVGEIVAQLFYNSWGSKQNIVTTQGDAHHDAVTVTHPFIVFIVLSSVCVASVFSSLETVHSAAVISLVSFTRFLACSTLGDLPQSLRPHIAYICGLLGVIISKYMETVLKPPINNFMTHDGKISVIKRRRSSSSSAHAFSAHRSTRRTSLPALIPKSQVRSAENACLIVNIRILIVY